MDDAPQTADSTPGQSSAVIRQRRFRFGAGIAIAVIVAIVIWLVVSNNDSSTPSVNTNAVVMTPSGLTTLAGSLKQPIYWVGPMDDVTYEMLRTNDGRILLGYDPPGMKVGENKPHLTVGTYPVSDAYAVTQAEAAKPGRVRIDIGGGAVAFYNQAFPLSSFVSYPGSGYQIEVYDPTPGRSRELVAAGKVKTVPGSPAETTGAVAVTPGELAKRSADANQPIYWAGPMPKTTYELKETSQRWFLVRYLPKGTEVGTGKGYLTIGTYPLRDAFAATQHLAQETDAKTYNLPNGAIAVSNPKHFPYSVFVAYPGSNYQIEVFNPVLARARQLVTSGKIAAAG